MLGQTLNAEFASGGTRVAHQHRSAWSHEVDLRPWSDAAWWN